MKMKKKYKKLSVVFLFFVVFCVSICFIPINATKFIPIIEKQVANDLGVNVHIEKLIFRFGPSLKVKAPVMHVMYKDGQKFSQFDNVKFFIPWSSLFKDDVIIKRVYADKFILKISSSDKYLNELLSKMGEKKFEETPDLDIKAYSVNYYDKSLNKNLKFSGSNFDITKIISVKNYKVSTIGNFSINDKKYISYDISITPNVKMPENVEKNLNYKDIISQIESLDFHSDIIADLKLYNTIDGVNQISGLVNVDNISVLDPTHKSPKSFIYLTFLGDKIGVLSNIYASNDKKIYVDGVINNSKKFGLDLKVKSDEIQLSDIYQKLKLITDFSDLKNIDRISGSLKADFNIKGDVNKVKSAGYLKINNASIKAKGIEINKINSDIDFSNNTISIVNMIGYVKNSPILVKGKIDKNIDIEVLMNKVELSHLCPMSLGIKNGIVSLAANISGTFDNIVHKENIQLENFNASLKKYDLKFNSLKIDTNKNNIAYVNNISIKTPNIELIKMPVLKLNVERDTIKVPDTNIFMANSKLTAKAEISNFSTKDVTFNVSFDGFINSRDIKGLNAISNIYPIKARFNGNREVQNIGMQLLFEKSSLFDEPSLINFVAKIENNNLKIDDLSVLSYNGRFFGDIKPNLKAQRKILLTGNIEELFTRPIFKNVRLFIPQQLNITLGDTIAQIKGDLFLNGKVNSPEIIGQLSVQNLINQFLQLNVGNMTVDFNKNVAIINAPALKIADSFMSVNSVLSTDFTKGVLVKNTTVKSKYINTDTFLMYKDNPIVKSVPITINNGKFYSEKATLSIYNSPLYLSAVNADFEMKDNLLMVRNISSEIFNGKIAGSLDFNLKDENFKSVLQARSVSAAPIFDIIAIKKDTVSGIMDFDTTMQGNLASKSSLDGNIKFIVHNGRMGTLGKLEHLLYAQNVVADNMLRTSLSVVTKAITLKDTGLFKYLRGDIKLKSGIAHINMLQSQGPLMSLFIKGSYNTITDYGKLQVLGRLSDEVISGLGAFGEFSWNKLLVMLTGQDSKYNILPEDFDLLPQLPMKNTKEFRSIINGPVESPSSVIQFNWISYSQKSMRQADVPMSNVKIPDFIDKLPY